ncbi:hypothetical protein [Thermococcus radiotolerans]|uniref:Uncharacterized protein n=1 Tax=Thermococcus radiotolerans TaxID=187880 RepID=A0A2Z2MUQ4_9EURY|nr:hypothetical protein [Thermococcus radiotolerans]ASJ13675.1 hypothetical protein A3L10_00465 [Thermococcus radiotolerans]
MKLVRDLTVLFALLVSISLLLWAQPESRGSVDFYLGIALVVLVFLLIAIWMELERLEDRILELEFILGESRGDENDAGNME